MKVIETLLIEQENGLFEILTEGIPFAHMNFFNVPVYRLQIEPDLVILLYKLDENTGISVEILNNIFPYLKRIILISSGESFHKWRLPKTLVEYIKNVNGDVPKFLILLSKSHVDANIKNSFLKDDLLPARFTREIFCRPEDKNMIRQTWKMVWGRFTEGE